jgi:hypothetical protein
MLAAGLMLIAPAPQAEASSLGWSSGAEQPALTWSSGWYSRWKKKIRKYRMYKRKKRARVPELDASTAGSAMVLLLGGVAYIASRRRDEDDA